MPTQEFGGPSADTGIGEKHQSTTRTWCASTKTAAVPAGRLRLQGHRSWRCDEDLFEDGDRDFFFDLYGEIFAELADVTVPSPLGPPAEPVRVPVVRHPATGELVELVPDPVQEYPMVPVAEDLFVVRERSTRSWVPVTFHALPTGERYVHFDVRATPKVG